MNGHRCTELGLEGIPVTGVIGKCVDDRARKEHERVRVGQRANKAEPPDLRALRGVEPHDEEWDRRLGGIRQHELKRREATVDQLDQI